MALAPLTRSDPPTVGPYRVLARLGEGGMGRVYLGYGRDGRPVAVKHVRAENAADHTFRHRFNIEVVACRRVSGAYTSAVVQHDADAAHPWLATEFVAGPTLRDVLGALGGLPEDAVLRLAAGLASALAEIHRAGLVHRDMKPSNILLNEHGVRVIDFGIARITDDGERTVTHAVLGSPMYMSPEQADGKLGPVGWASDVFSLGSVLYEACTGTRAFGADLISQTWANIVNPDYQPSLTDVPGRMRPIITECLTKSPTGRPEPARILELIGTLEPSARPWPPEVHTQIEEHRAELARYLDGTVDDAEAPERTPGHPVGEADRLAAQTRPYIGKDPPAGDVPDVRGDGRQFRARGVGATRYSMSALGRWARRLAAAGGAALVVLVVGLLGMWVGAASAEGTEAVVIATILGGTAGITVALAGMSAMATRRGRRAGRGASGGPVATARPSLRLPGDADRELRTAFGVYVRNGRLFRLPAAEVNLLPLLGLVADTFDLGRGYDHAEVTHKVRRVCDRTLSYADRERITQAMFEHEFLVRTVGGRLYTRAPGSRFGRGRRRPVR